MSYTTLKFLIFVAVVLVCYFSFPVKKYQWTILLAASYWFYLLTGYRYAAYILFTTVTTYLSALWMDHIARKSKAVLEENKKTWDRDQKKAFKAQTKQRKHVIATVTLVANLGILVFLKYFNFFSGSLNDLLGNLGVSFSVPTLKLLLPLGISFYTFQSIGYVIDVYREKVEAERNFFKIALFVSFFPQIIQGPIGLYDHLAKQLYEPHIFDFGRFKHGCMLMLWGYFKKMVIADRAVIPIMAVIDAYDSFGGTALLFTVLMYALQLYADFSGGIDITRGIAQTMGIEMAENFCRPYFSRTINEYWRRWHMSLGAWMREYVFYPIAVSKTFLNASKSMKKSRFGATPFGAHVSKVLATSFASLIVFFLVGIWHGANWKYVGFGIWNGGVIMLSTILEPTFASWTERLRIRTETFCFRVFQMVRTFAIVLIGYVFDIAPDLQSSMITFKKIAAEQDWALGLKQYAELGLDVWDYGLLAVCTCIVFFASLIQERNPDRTIREMLDQKPFLLRFAVILAGIMLILVFGIYGPEFAAAEFVYMQF